MKDQFSVRDIMRILKCCDQTILNDVKAGKIRGHKIKTEIIGRHDAWAFSFVETARYINAKINAKRRKR